MRNVAEPTFVQTNNVGETRRATIKTSAKMFNFFSKQIYTDFYTAAWRELVANGYDGQKVNGVNRPVVVTVPSMLEPYAKVRDFGCSMTHSFMLEQFMAFGDASTKEHSDDFIGGFGIGSKAPLAYTDQYSIRCFMDGTVRVYSVFKDADGCPSIAFLSESPTSEPDGVEVAFPVRQDDISKFSDTVVQTLQYFDPQPILENTELELTPIKYDACGDKWGLRVTGADRRPKIIIGGVSYPLDVSKVPYQYQNIRNFASLGLDVYLGIGEANIALSREHVTHDDALFEKLNGIIANIADEFGKQMSKAFDTSSSEWDAKLKLGQALDGADYTTANLLRKHAYWQGNKITPYVTRPKDYEVLLIAYGNFGWQPGLLGIPTTEATSPKFRAWEGTAAHFEPRAFTRIIIDDKPEKPSLRIRGAIEKHQGEKLLFLRWNDPSKKADWAGYLKALGSPPKDMITYLSKYQPVKVARATKGNAARSFKCYVQSNPPYRSKYGQSEKNELPKDGGLYIVMDNFVPLSSRSDIDLASKVNPKNIVWLNKTDFASSDIENNKAFFSVEQAIAKFKDEYRSKHRDLPEAEAWYRLTVNSKSSILNKLEKLCKLSSFPKRGPLFQLNRLREKHEPVADASHSKLRSELLGVKYDDQLKKMEALVADAMKKHPHVEEIAENYQFHRFSYGLINALF